MKVKVTLLHQQTDESTIHMTIAAMFVASLLTGNELERYLLK